MSQMCTDYPVPVCDRLTPVPAADLTLINRKHGKDYPTLCKNEQGRSKTADILNPWNTYQIISKPIALKSHDSTFPAAEDFLLARTAIKEGGVVPATVQALDLKILDNHVGYSKFSTGAAYYFQKNLQLHEREAGTKDYVGRLYLSVFTERGYHCNSIHSIVATFAHIRKAKTSEEKVDKACLQVLLWTSLRIYGVLNGRILMQDAQPGDKYDEAKTPFVLAFFEQRDCSCQVDFEKKVLQPALADYKTLDMVAFATKHNFAEFFWLCCSFARCIADEMKLEIFPAKAIAKFCGRDMSEHWATYMMQSHIREVKVEGLPDLLNARSKELACKTASSFFRVEDKKGQQNKNGFSISETYRVRNSRTATPSIQFGKGELQKINWPGFLAKYSLLTWTNLDPTRADWDTSQAYFKNRYSNPKQFEIDVGVAQFIILHGSFAITATDALLPHPDAFPPVNTLRLAYSMFSNEEKRLCVTPPLAISNPSMVAPAVTSPANIQFPCWKWLLTSGMDLKVPAADDTKRRRHVLCPRDEKRDMVPVGGGSDLYLPTEDPAIKELFGPAAMDLLWRVQLVRNTGFYKLYPLAHTLKPDPELPANLGDLPWSSEAEPMPGTFDVDAYRQAAFMRINNYPGLSRETKDLCDQPVRCWQMYRAYLQGCVLYLNEVDVIRHVVVTTFGNMQGFLAALDKSKNPTDVFTGMLINLQWGERLWRNMLYVSSIDAINCQTAPVTRQVRKEFLKLYPVHRQSGKVHTLINETFFKNSQTKVAESALLQRPDFWKELLRQFNAAVRVEGDEQDDATPAHDIPQVLQVLASGVVDSDEDDLGGQLILRSHILPVHRSVCPTMRFEYKSPMAIYTRLTELNPALRAIAHRRFVQPLCLLAATMFPAMDTMRYTSSADGKAYKWNQLVMQSDTDPLILSIGRQFRVVIQSALARAKAADVDWKEEIEAIQQKSGQLPDGVLLAMSSLFAEPAIEKARKKAAAEEKKKQPKKKKKESPPPPPPDGPGKKEFTAAAETEARRKQVDNVALQILRQSLEMPRGGGQARFVSHSAIMSLIALYGHTTHAGVQAAAERKTFDMLALRLSDAELQTTAKKLSEADEPLMTKLYMHLTAKDAKKPEVKKSKPIARPAPPRAQQQPPKGPDLTARKATQPEVEDFAAQDADEAEENRYLLEGLSKSWSLKPQPPSSSSSSNSKRPGEDSAAEPAAKRAKTDAMAWGASLL